MTYNKYKKHLTENVWKEMVVQGGQLTLSPNKDAYLLSGLWLAIAQNIWIELSAIEVVSNEYYLCLSFVNSPIPETNKLFIPPRKPLEECPEDCRLNELIGKKNDFVFFEIFESSKKNLLLESPLEVVANSGRRFQFQASTRYLSHIELRML
jgi:hypothetical protein